MAATLLPVACVTRKRRSRARRLIRPLIESASVTRNIARDKGLAARIVTTIRRGRRNDGKSVRRALSNISRWVATPARPVIMDESPSAVIWILKIAGAVTPGRVFGLARD